jgi:hypothetical protein
MKSPTFLLFLFPLLTAAAAVKTLPDVFDLLAIFPTSTPAPIWNNVMFANGTAYVGDIKYSIYSEPLLSNFPPPSLFLTDGGKNIVTGGKDALAHTFTSFHQTPTGWQTLYVLADQSRGMGFSTPHSASFPEGAVYRGFGAGHGGFLVLDRGGGGGVQELWVACRVSEAAARGSWAIVWDGRRVGSGSGCVPVRLKVGTTTDCRLPRG